MKEKILVILFIGILVFPNMYWNVLGLNEEGENLENRNLAERPQLNIQTVEDFPKNYENYYNDHLAFRNEVINITSLIDYKVFHTINSEKVLLGKNNWLFYKGAGVEELEDEAPVKDYLGTNIYTQNEMEVIAKNINIVSGFLKEKEIEFSVMICPNKENIYGEYMPDGYVKVNENNKASILVNYLNKHTDVKIFYPIEDLNKYSKKYQLYYKYDTHWNRLGAFVAEQQIKEMYQGISEDIEDVTIEYNTSIPKDLANMVNMPDEFTDDKNYFLTDYNNGVQEQLIESTEDGTYSAYTSNAKDSRRIMLIRDSYGEAMMGYLARDFKDTIFVHRGVFDQGYIDIFQPDIVIYEVVERATDDMKDMAMIFQLE